MDLPSSDSMTRLFSQRNKEIEQLQGLHKLLTVCIACNLCKATESYVHVGFDMGAPAPCRVEAGRRPPDGLGLDAGEDGATPPKAGSRSGCSQTGTHLHYRARK